MRERSDVERVLGLALATLCALIGVTCAGATRVPDAPPAAAASAPPASPNSPAVATSSAAPPAPAATAASPALSLPRFYAALAGRRDGSSVRVLWLGDSHTLADFMSGEVRSRLARRFGAGGPGFLQPTNEAYTRAGARVETRGPWRRLPKSPAKVVAQDDTVFGMAGTRLVGEAGARLGVEAPDALERPLRWEIAFRLPSAQDDFEIRSGAVQRFARQAPRTESAIQRLVLEAAAPKLEIDVRSGKPELFGVVLEANRGGVVVDTLGQNGARTATPLAWDERAFVEQAAARSPALFVLAYGTNDVVSELSPERLGEHYARLVARLRKAAPEADCLLVGPPDLARNGATHARVQPIEDAEMRSAAALGCAYFSAFRAMGGDGGMRAWMQEAPPLGAADGVHLTPAGYARLGGALADALLAGFEATPRASVISPR